LKLSVFFSDGCVRRDSDFEWLGHTSCQQGMILVYCETIQYIYIANQNSHVACVITNEALSEYVSTDKGMVVEETPRLAFYKLHKKLLQTADGVHQVEARMGKNCKIHPTAQLSDKCSIGDGVTINENAVICAGVTIGDNAFIDVGVVVGSEGNLHVSVNEMTETIRHGGGVVIGKGATLLTNSVVVKSIHPSQLTVVGDYSIIGIASNIGHDANVGKNCVVSGNCVIARGGLVGDQVLIGTSSVVREYVSIGEKAEVKAGSIVVEDILAGESVSGNFAVRHRKHLMQYAKSRG
jgi:UDP-3-O-[3-hydroxymyristoyl] glucosamine N-acyltransferase